MNRYSVADSPVGILDSGARNSPWRATESPFSFRPIAGDAQRHAGRVRSPAVPARVPARAARYTALGAASALVPGSPTASGAGGGGEPVAAGLVGGQLGGAEADELVQGVGDRAGRPGEHLADLVRGEGRVGERTQVLLD